MLPCFHSKVFLAPMAGVTNAAFRTLCVQYGVGLTGTELISARGIVAGNEKTLRLLDVSHDTKPVFIQLFGDHVPSLITAVERIEKKCSLIDLNLGCPSPKVFDSGGGSALLRKPALVKEIVSSLVSVSSKPISVKMRTGLDAKHITSVKIARICESAGASLITIHGRTKNQGYSGVANLDHIKKVVAAVSIPVVGNGDVRCGADALRMIKYTDCSFVAVGRAAIGDPHIFTRINTFLKTGKEMSPLSLSEKITLLQKYFGLCKKFELDSLHHMKCATQQFLVDFKGVRKLRAELNTVKKKEDILALCQRLL